MRKTTNKMQNVCLSERARLRACVHVCVRVRMFTCDVRALRICLLSIIALF